MIRHRNLYAFTFVELLVVIAIIAVLIAILLGPMMKVRRRAAVLATPVVTATEDGAIDLIHPHGVVRIDLAPPHTLCWNSFNQGPHWSPGGMSIGHTIHIDAKPESLHQLAIVNAATGNVRRFASIFDTADRFPGWADDDHFIEVDDRTATICIRDATSGVVTQKIANSQWHAVYQQTSLVPLGVIGGGYYITASDAGGAAKNIVILRRNFTVRKLIYTDPACSINPTPRVDPFGEFVAWTTGNASIAVKSVTAPTCSSPQIFPGTFCDWTEDGKILANRQGQLIILSPDGRLLDTVPFRGGPWYYQGTASWRKYTHQ